MVSSMEGGGAERVAAMLCNRWGDTGHNVRLIPTFSRRGAIAYPLSSSVEVVFLSDHVGVNASRFYRLRRLRSQIVEWEPDVIVSFLPHVNVAAIIAAMGTNVPVIVSERTYPPAMPMPLGYRLQRRLAYPFADAIVAQTEITAEWLRKRFGAKRVHVIPNPVEYPIGASEPIRSPDGLIGASRRVILWAGRFDQYKRPGLMIDSFARIVSAHPEWDLAMIGNGELHMAMTEKVAALGLSDRIHLPGFAGNLGDWYERADLYVMTSAFEGFPNTMLEAMAHGIATVAFDVPTGPRELSDQGTRLMLLPENHHVESLSAAMLQLMSDDAARLKLAAAAAQVRQAYSIHTIAEQWLSLFRDLSRRSLSAETKF